MEQWSILSNVFNYIQYDRHFKNLYDLDIKAIDYKGQKKMCSREEERLMLNIDFGNTLEKLKEEYLDMYEGIQSEIFSTMRFDENSDLITMYLGKVGTTRASKIKAEEKFPISEQGYAVKNYWMVQNVKYYWIQELANHLCLNHIIYIVSHFIHYPDLHLKHR